MQKISYKMEIGYYNLKKLMMGWHYNPVEVKNSKIIIIII